MAKKRKGKLPTLASVRSDILKKMAKHDRDIKKILKRGR